MKLKNMRGNEIDLETYISNKLESDEYDRGKLEDLESEMRKHSRAITNLVSFLVSKNLMNQDDVIQAFDNL